jgi:hypothetical protein
MRRSKRIQKRIEVVVDQTTHNLCSRPIANGAGRLVFGQGVGHLFLGYGGNEVIVSNLF